MTERCRNCGQLLPKEPLEEGEHPRYTLDRWWEALRENPALRCGYVEWVQRCIELDKEDG